MLMSFFNSLPIRIPLALIGGILYGLLTRCILILLDLPAEFTLFASGVVFLFYLGSRILLLFCGFDTPYYSKGAKAPSGRSHEVTSFYRTAQWVGKFYHDHDIVLLALLTLLSIIFLISLAVDWTGHKPLGDTILNLWDTFIFIS